MADSQLMSAEKPSNTKLIMRLKTSQSKGSLLLDLRSKLELFCIPDSFLFSVGEWKAQPEQILSIIQKKFAKRILVVRSSATREDNVSVSLAGKYQSVLGVPCDECSALQVAIAKVLESYLRDGDVSNEDEILVQEMVQNVSLSGVIFTHEINTGAPYYVVNYDDISGLTNTVTSGSGEYANRTLYIYRSATEDLRSERFQRLIGAVQELERLLGSEFLDVEFALGVDLKPYLFQVRTITTQPNWNRHIARRIDSELHGIQLFLRDRFGPSFGVFGRTTVFGQMPDWNPAEMIGRAPRALAFSLYRMLITDHAWRRAREQMGYASPHGQPLMVSLAGQPFIDTRLSFHSYLPAELPGTVASKLVDACVARLCQHPELHDKIEFDVAITAYSFDVDVRLNQLVGDTLTISERGHYKDALRRLTLPLLRGEGDGALSKALDKINSLRGRPLPSECSGPSDLMPIIEDCIRLGTEPFAVLARHAFIAQTLLSSLVTRGALSEDDLSRFRAGIRTVASDLVDDMRRLRTGELSGEAFMEFYGHLRPGTYDILSPRYDQMEDFFTWKDDVESGLDRQSLPFKLNARQRRLIDGLLSEDGLTGLDSQQLLNYCSAAIAGREYGKFSFTRSVSAILELIAHFGERHGLSRSELSHIPIGAIFEVALSSSDMAVEASLRAISEREAARHSVSSAVRLPQVLFDEAGVHVIPFQACQPNFITHLKVTGDTVFLDSHQIPPNLEGRVVLIANADPGFDWVFSQRIAALVTKYGGANSHMAIRCAEFGIPAAIGCGDQRFEAFLRARQLCIDCSSRMIIPVC